MTRTRLAALLPLLALLLLPGTASAQTTVTDVVDALLSDGLYVDPDADIDVEESRVRAALAESEAQIYIAVLPQAAGKPIELVPEIGNQLGDDNAVLLVLTDAPDAYTDQASGADARGINAGQALRQARASTNDTTDRLVLFVRTIDAQASGGGSGGGSSEEDEGSALLGGLVLAGLGGGGAFLYARSRKRHKRALEDARADVESLYGRLGSDVQLLSPGDDDV